MKSRLRISIIIVILILLSMLAVNLSAAQPNAKELSSNITSHPADNPWRTIIVHQQFDPPLELGLYTSLALRPFDDHPYISYADASNGELFLADPGTPGHGNCGPNSDWWCRSVDVINDWVGFNSSIDLWSNLEGTQWKLGISYFDLTDYSLKAAIWTENHGWHFYTIQVPESDSVRIGVFTSIKFSSTGIPSIAYYLLNYSSFDSLWYAHLVDGGGNCGAFDNTGLWQCELVDFGEGVGQYASLDFGFDDSINIAYYDAGLGNLKYAYYDGIGDCYMNNGWNCFTIDGNDGSDVGMHASLKAPQSAGGVFRIAYYDRTNGNLKFYNQGLGVPLVVDKMYTPLALGPMGISMDIDTDGLAVIAYQQRATNSSPETLRLARPYLAYADGEPGDCGEAPPGWSKLYWRCTTLDSGGQFIDEADFVSLAVDSHGLVLIAYSEAYTPYSVTGVKLIYQVPITQTFLPILIKP